MQPIRIDSTRNTGIHQAATASTPPLVQQKRAVVSAAAMKVINQDPDSVSKTKIFKPMIVPQKI